MKVQNPESSSDHVMPVMTLALLVLLSLMLAGWQLFDLSWDSGVQVYLPMVQSALLLIAVTLGVTFHKMKTDSYRTQDVLGLTQAAAGLSFKNAEALLGAAAGGIIRVNRDYQAEYLNENAEQLLGMRSEDAFEKPVLEIVSLQGGRHTARLRQIIEDQFLKPDSQFDLHDVKLVTPGSEVKYAKLRTAPVLNDKGIVEYVVLLVQDITTDKHAMEELYRQASLDSMTGLYNRRSFQEFLETTLAESRNNGNETNVLCYMDLDHFKTVNDVCGHAAGDELLKQIADLFSKRIRSSDKLARMGGDEFAILLTRCSVERAQVILGRILEDIASYRFTWDQNSFSIGVSMGAVEFDSSYRVSDIGKLMLSADEACYVAKNKGRNQLYVKSNDDGVNTDIQGNNDNWEKVLNAALRQGNFELYIQPILPLKETAALDALQYEVLIRLRHNGEILSPGSFMPAAQRLGMMGSLDRWVVDKTISCIAEGLCDHQQSINQVFTVNLSSESVNDESFVDFVEAILEDKGVPGSMLCFEISESVVLANLVQVQGLLNRLIEIGSVGSLDDFGSSISSLNYLRDLPVSYLKIDGSFIRSMSKNKIDAAMVEAVNKVGQLMDFVTIAEAVENDITKQLLKRMGVDYAQGYHCGTPFAFAELYAAKAS